MLKYVLLWITYLFSCLQLAGKYCFFKVYHIVSIFFQDYFPLPVQEIQPLFCIQAWVRRLVLEWMICEDFASSDWVLWRAGGQTIQDSLSRKRLAGLRLVCVPLLSLSVFNYLTQLYLIIRAKWFNQSSAKSFCCIFSLNIYCLLVNKAVKRCLYHSHSGFLCPNTKSSFIQSPTL